MVNLVTHVCVTRSQCINLSHWMVWVLIVRLRAMSKAQPTASVLWLQNPVPQVSVFYVKTLIISDWLVFFKTKYPMFMILYSTTHTQNIRSHRFKRKTTISFVGKKCIFCISIDHFVSLHSQTTKSGHRDLQWQSMQMHPYRHDWL